MTNTRLLSLVIQKFSLTFLDRGMNAIASDYFMDEGGCELMAHNIRDGRVMRELSTRLGGGVSDNMGFICRQSYSHGCGSGCGHGHGNGTGAGFGYGIISGYGEGDGSGRGDCYLRHGDNLFVKATIILVP